MRQLAFNGHLNGIINERINMEFHPYFGYQNGKKFNLNANTKFWI